MLRHLTIKNIVLLKSVELEFPQGLTVLTGETGAGKSILLDALGLVLGKRSDTKLVRAGEEMGSVVAEFDIIQDDALKAWLEEQGLGGDNLLIIRRIIKSDGSSKAYVNDQAVTQKILKELGEWLIVIHGQHGQRGLLDASTHAAMLDGYGKHTALAASTAQAYHAWREANKHYTNLQESLQQALREQDYLTHIVQELNIIRPKVGEEAELAEKRQHYLQAEKLGLLLQECEQGLSGGTPSVAEQLRRVQMSLIRANLDDNPHATLAIESLERAQHELAEAEMAVHRLSSEIAYDEAALERTEERLFALREMARKYRMSADELPDYLVRATASLQHIVQGDAALQDAAKEVARCKAVYQQEARSLHAAREKAIPALIEAVHTNLAPLKMAATRLRVVMSALPESAWRASGMEEVRFEVATNMGSHYGGLQEVASGGELSRLMLAMHVVLRDESRQNVLIFDEIDTGTGGAVAEAIGMRLKMLAAHSQVLVVTHQPQVAAQAHHHFFIAKDVVDGNTSTSVTPLDANARHEELARMLSGATVTEEARLAASKLLALA
jgi:DNA repair protein RecN (Recombination protein N)